MVERLVPGVWAGHQVDELELVGVARLSALTRLGKAQVPAPNLVVQEGDAIWMMVSGDGIDTFDNHLSVRTEQGEPLMKVVIAGGGNVGTYIADELHRAQHEVVIVEVDPRRVAEAIKSGEPAGVKWLQADGCEVSELMLAEPGKADVMVAVTGDDEDNLVISLLAKQEFGVPRVVARINNPANEWLFNESWGIDVAVSTPHLLTALVEEAVSVGSLVRLLAFEGGRVRLSEVTLADNSPAGGKEIVDLGLPRDSTVVAILRQDRVVVPRGDTVLYGGDEVIVMVTNESEEEVRQVLIG